MATGQTQEILTVGCMGLVIASAFTVGSVANVVNILPPVEMHSVQTAGDNSGFADARLRLAALQRAEDGWDGEGAPRPSAEAIARAFGVLNWAERAGLRVSDVDADVLGGVAVWLKGDLEANRLSAWIACMNNGHDTVVLSAGDEVHSHGPWNPAGQDETVAFLAGSEHANAPA
jgi:hypothetical protein